MLEEDSFIGSFVNAIKIFIRGVLHYLGIRRQQFWGWRRTRDEYRQIFKQAGLTEVKDGWLQDGGHIYVCGDASRMARDVDRALDRKSVV